MFQRGLFVFRQDLRITDNTGLIAAMEQCDEVIPVFVFDEPILARFQKPDARVGFLIETLRDLQAQLRSRGSNLWIFHGVSTQILPQIAETIKCNAIFRNKSYGIGSTARDQEIAHWCARNDISVQTYVDYLLVEPSQVETRKVFTPFYHLWQTVTKRLPAGEPIVLKPTWNILFETFWSSLLNINVDAVYERLEAKKQSFWSRAHCEQRMHIIPITHYDDQRNFPEIERGTSMLSPYLRFGLVSPRQVLARVIDGSTPGTIWDGDSVTMDKKVFKNSFVSELAWREFRWHIDWWFPETRSVAFQEKRRHIRWENREDRFLAWKEWCTGYPIVDAGMRQLRAMGRMHGRVRMIVASFLCKDLLIDWVWWERYFADLLMDYDAAVNMGNRQRSASVGADPKPLRIFNPILQSQKFDPDATYIKRWLPELSHVPAVQLHDPITFDLPRHTPIVNHYVTSKMAKELYKGVR